MFARSSRGLLDLTMAALCVWAAAWHTPAGALIRVLTAKVAGAQSNARPLLAYYSGGVYDAERVQMPTVIPVVPGVPEVEVPGSALGKGALAALEQADPRERLAAQALAAHYGSDAPDTAARVSTVLERARTEFQTDDAAVLALFAGYEVAHYAVGRARGEGRLPTLEALVQQLPPSSEPAIRSASAALTLGTAYALAWPLPERTVITSPFGYRENPMRGSAGRQFHPGIDLRAPEGTQVHSVAPGIVRRASYDGLNGNIVIIDHGYGVLTAYCHNSSLLVKVGDRVGAGDVISLSGTTGRSNAPHLHYQVELAHTPTDPLAFKTGEPRAALLPVPAPPRNGGEALKGAFERAQQVEAL